MVNLFALEQESTLYKSSGFRLIIFKQVAQWATIAHLGASIMFENNIIMMLKGRLL